MIKMMPMLTEWKIRLVVTIKQIKPFHLQILEKKLGSFKIINK